MTPLQFMIIFVSIIFVFFGIDLFKRKKLNALHLIVFVLGAWTLILFAVNWATLDRFGNFFWVARWADLVVYWSIVLLAYSYVSLLNKLNRNDLKNTQIIREISISQAEWNLWNTDTVFIMPAYGENEAPIPVIGKILDKWYSVILIDDGKNWDLTKKLHKKYKWKPIVTIKHIVNLWQWWWLETGAEYVRRFWDKIKYVVHFDSDGQHRLEDLGEFQRAFKEDPQLEIVLWSRFLGSTINMPKSKKVTLKLGILFTRVFSWIKLTDTHNGYRMMKKETLDKIHITMNRMEHASEILDIIKSKKIRYKEVPIVVIYSDYSMSKWQKISNAFNIVKNLIYKKIFFR